MPCKLFVPGYPASRGEKTAKTWRHRRNYSPGELFRRQHLPVISAEQNDSKSEEINAIGKHRQRTGQFVRQNVSFVRHLVLCVKRPLKRYIAR